MRLRSLKKSYSIDASISYLEGANYVNLLSRYRDRIIISVRGSKVLDMNITGLIGMIRLKFLLPIIYRFADRIIALSHGIKSELIEEFQLNARRIDVIYNFYDLDETEVLKKLPIPKAFELVFEGETLISAGRLSTEKGFDHLLNVYVQLKKLKPETKLVFLGDGPSRKLLVDYSKSLGLNTYSIFYDGYEEAISSDVFFLGYQQNPLKFFSRSTLFILASQAEGGPNVLSEAMSCGLPVMSADCPSGPRERLSYSSNHHHAERITTAEFADFGVLMPPFDKEEDGQILQIWVETLDKVLSNKQLLSNYSEKAQLRMKDFTKSNIFPLWERVVFR